MPCPVHVTESGLRLSEALIRRHGLPLAFIRIGAAIIFTRHIAAYSPQARGRPERVFHTLQDRLTKELALAGIATIEAANAFIRDVYVPAHNARFAVEAEREGAAFVAIPCSSLYLILQMVSFWRGPVCC